MYSLLTATNEFIGHCKFEKNLSSKTIKAYQIDLKQLFKFLEERKYSSLISAITKIQLREYLENISTLKPKSIKRKIATIKAMFNYLEFEDTITVNPLRKMRINIKEPKRLPKVLDITEIKEIFKTAYARKTIGMNKKSYSYRESLMNIAVVELLFATGARVSEIADLRSDQLNLTLGTVTLKGKGDIERSIQICNRETLSILKIYYALFETRINKCGGYFLINRFDTKLSDQSIRNIVKTLSNKAGLQRHITPHSFRHTFAILLLEKDVDIKYIQLLLGHSSIMTTQIYTHVNKAKQREILRTKHPRKDFSMS